jgi:8-oxo-dGTP pyrophosphatase MutT (NUDIX family)
MRKRLDFDNVPNYPVLDEDGNERWVSRSVVNVALIKWNNKVVVVKRATNENITMGGYWCMPCGYLDWNENIEEAVVREVYEETGIDLREHLHTMNLVEVISEPYGRKQDVSFHYLIEMDEECSVPPAIDKTVLDTEETVDAVWIKWEEIKHLDVAFNHDFRIMANFLNDKNGN